MKLWMGIDVGTTAARAVLVDSAGTMDAATTAEPEASQIHPNRRARASKSVISAERQLRLQSRGLVIREEK